MALHLTAQRNELAEDQLLEEEERDHREDRRSCEWQNPPRRTANGGALDEYQRGKKQEVLDASGERERTTEAEVDVRSSARRVSGPFAAPHTLRASPREPYRPSF